MQQEEKEPCQRCGKTEGIIIPIKRCGIDEIICIGCLRDDISESLKNQ